MSVNDCKLIQIPTFTDQRGSLSVLELNNGLPFEIRRIYYLYDVAATENRGEHAHKELEQIIIAISGSFEIIVDDGTTTQKYTLNKPNIGLYVCPMIWRKLHNFTDNTVCVVLASAVYQENDYYRKYGEFKKATQPTYNYSSQ